MARRGECPPHRGCVFLPIWGTPQDTVAGVCDDATFHPDRFRKTRCRLFRAKFGLFFGAYLHHSDRDHVLAGGVIYRVWLGTKKGTALSEAVIRVNSVKMIG